MPASDGLRVRRAAAGRDAFDGSSDDFLAHVDRTFNDLGLERTKKAAPARNILGYTEWLIVLVLIAGLYAFVVWQDHRLPAVVPANQHGNFSEERARIMLKSITDLGPRPSGSEALEKHAFRVITDKLNALKETTESIGVNRLEIEVDRPTGCFDLKFLSSFTLCYHKITNILARIGPSHRPTKHALLLNCHFDTLPDTPGATDDAVSCAIMLEVLENLAHSKEALPNDVILLFNGAEENFLQASHGFITQHKWRHQIRAFINLEGTGAGGREILFQAGPGDSWLLKTYLDHAPHPHCSVLAQEIFQSGVIPSDTDFRIFRDYGRISGLDVAYHRHGWFYHTEFDRPEFIANGSIQRGGDNVLAVVKAMIASPYLEQPANFNEGNKWVFYDIVGLFTVHYNIEIGSLINYSVVVLVLILISHRLSIDAYAINDLGAVFFHHIAAFSAMVATGITLAGFITAIGYTMMWYSTPELVFPIYILPMIVSGLAVHSSFSENTRNGLKAELVHYDSVLLIWAFLLFLTTTLGYASSFYLLIHVIFPLLRDPIIWAVTQLGVTKSLTPRTILTSQFLCMAPVMIFISYAVMLFFDFFVPVMGRLGNLVNPEWVMMTLSLLTATTFVLYTNNLIYVSRNMKYLYRCSIALFALFALALVATQIGVPYKYSEDSPRLRRLITLHAKRTIYDFNGDQTDSSTALFIQSFDYRGINDLPEHAFLQANQRPNCTGIEDEYCRLPYYTAIHELFPPQESIWVPVPVAPALPKPLNLKLVERTQLNGNQLNLTFNLKGGVDKVSLHVTPLNGYRLKNWSFKEFNPAIFAKRNTFFVFMSYGFEAPVERNFWILLEHASSAAPPDPETVPSLELAVATHYAHGPYQNSDTLIQLRNLFITRRRTPTHGVGFWKWAITTVGGVSEIIVRPF
uniref:FXNA-like protease n=1 Tax=Panagrellus redivivus TaxID=6233 RepID=A0A7E4VJ68_PANRE